MKTHSSQRARRGSIYVAVLGVAMIVAIIGMSAMQLSRLQLRDARSRQDTNEARFLAQSGVEFALARIQLDPFWRTNYMSGTIASPITYGGGTIEFSFTDPVDGNLSNNSTDKVEIRGIGKVGDAVFVYVAEYAPDSSGAMALVPGSWQRTTYDY